MTRTSRPMLREDLTLLRHLASSEGAVTVVATARPAWFPAVPRATFAPALDVEACRRVPQGTVVLLDGSVSPDGLAVLHERGLELLQHDGCSWRRLRARNAGSRWRLFVERNLPLLARQLGVLRLLPPFRHDGGSCWWTSLRGLRLPAPGSDRSAVLFEDGVPLLLRDSPHADIREQGRGRHSVWQRGLYFSASDNSDPHHNGRRYELRVLRQRSDDALQSPACDEPAFTARFQALAAARTSAASSTANPTASPSSSRRVLLLLSSLGPGGAERQFCYLARALAARGHHVAIAALDGFAGAHGHYVPMLAGSGVELLDATIPAPGFDPAALEARNRGACELLEHLPQIFAAEAWRAATHVAARAPDVLHCALDKPNLLGAIAGVAARVPRIVLSARNVNPTHFPYIDQPWFRRWYQHAAEVPGLVLSANSQAGARDYAAWIGVPAARFEVVHNGLDAASMPVPPDEQVRALRSELGIASDAPVVAGLFRLSAEKQPLLWLDVIARLRPRFPRLIALHSGLGDLREPFAARVRELGLLDVVRLLGRRDDPLCVLRAADLLLLTSAFEGLPNAALEAQWLERPVVCTDAGGAREAVRDGDTGFVVREPDANLLGDACAHLLADPDRRARMGRAGRELVIREFDVERMVAGSLRLYGGPAAGCG
ncbi:MAG TPA: glycosyltransferase [Planctomycetota bacterium]